MSYENRVAGLGEEGLTEGYRQKVLICYLLHTTGKRLTASQLFEAIRRWQLFSFFELCDELQALTDSGHLTAEKLPNEEWTYAITPLGSKTSAVLESLLPRALKDAAAESALALLAREQKAGEGNAELVRGEDGRLFCRLELKDKAAPLLSCSLLVPDEIQGEQLKSRFLSDPAAFYRAVLSHLTDSHEPDKKDR